MIWGDISRYVNGENVLGGVAYKNKLIYMQSQNYGGGGGTCFSSFCLQKIGKGGGYLLFYIWRSKVICDSFYRCETEMSQGNNSNNTE